MVKIIRQRGFTLLATIGVISSVVAGVWIVSQRFASNEAQISSVQAQVTTQNTSNTLQFSQVSNALSSLDDKVTLLLENQGYTKAQIESIISKQKTTSSTVTSQ